MSLNNIQLPPIALQQLFKHSLVEIKNEQQKAPETSVKPLATLGNNSRNILILVSSDDALYLPDDELNFLMGIMAACNLTMNDVAILNIRKNELVTYKSITAQLRSEKIFLFGVKPATIELPLDFPHYQIQQYNNQVYLTAPALSHFHDNKAEKVKLWNCLKQIFSIA